MIVNMPEHFNVQKALDFSLWVKDKEIKDDVTFDYGKVKFMTPFGMLIFAHVIRKMMNDNPFTEFSDVNFEHLTYPAHMGYFKSVAQNYGNAPGQAIGSRDYLPITKLEVNELRLAAGRAGLPVPEYIEQICKPIATVLARGSQNAANLLTYALRELIRNAEEHSRSGHLWYAVQYWRNRNQVELTILDEGIGIKSSLAQSGYYKLESDLHANLLALQPGISRAFKGKQRRQGIYDNSGYGLFMTSQLTNYTGSFVLASGEAALMLARDSLQQRPALLQGTAVRLVLNTDKIDSISVILLKISEKGTRLQRDNDGFKEASLSSLLAILK
jgi:hypothetical protein